MTSPINPITAPPEKPDPYECCGSGCVPCIYDYYYDQLDEWENRIGMKLSDYNELQLEKSNITCRE